MKHFLSVIAVASLFQPMQAQVLFTYDFAGADPAGDAMVPSVAHLTLSPFGRVNVGVASQADVFSSSHWTTGPAMDPTEFVSFTLQPEAGFELHLDALTWDASCTSTGPQTARVDLFENGAWVESSTDFTIGTSMANRMFDFSDITASSGDTLELRFFGWNASSTGNLRLDNVAGMGAVTPVPEPQSCAVAAGVGLLVFAIHRRCRKERS